MYYKNLFLSALLVVASGCGPSLTPTVPAIITVEPETLAIALEPVVSVADSIHPLWRNRTSAEMVVWCEGYSCILDAGESRRAREYSWTVQGEPLSEVGQQIRRTFTPRKNYWVWLTAWGEGDESHTIAVMVLCGSQKCERAVYPDSGSTAK